MVLDGAKRVAIESKDTKKQALKNNIYSKRIARNYTSIFSALLVMKYQMLYNSRSRSIMFLKFE